MRDFLVINHNISFCFNPQKRKCNLICLTPPKSWATLFCKAVVFHYSKDSCKRLIMGRVQCSDEFFVKRLISKKKKKKKNEKKRKKERKVLFPLG